MMYSSDERRRIFKPRPRPVPITCEHGIHHSAAAHSCDFCSPGRECSYVAQLDDDD